MLDLGRCPGPFGFQTALLGLAFQPGGLLPFAFQFFLRLAGNPGSFDALPFQSFPLQDFLAVLVCVNLALQDVDVSGASAALALFLGLDQLFEAVEKGVDRITAAQVWFLFHSPGVFHPLFEVAEALNDAAGDQRGRIVFDFLRRLCGFRRQFFEGVLEALVFVGEPDALDLGVVRCLVSADNFARVGRCVHVVLSVIVRSV